MPKAFVRRWGVGMVALVGLLASLAALLPMVPWFVWVAGLVAGGVSWGAWLGLPQKAPHLPVDDLILGSPDEEQAFIEVPPSRDMLAASAEYARKVYGADALSFAELEAWWRHNPWVFLLLRSGAGEYLGHADVLPLTPAGYGLLRAGTTTEAELPLAEILPASRMREAHALYLAGITVRDCGTEAGKRRAAQLIGSLAEYVERIYGDDPARPLVAIAATDDGARLLKAMGARIVCAAQARKDRHDLYECPLTAERLEAIRTRARRRAAPAQMQMAPPLDPA